MLKNKKGFTLVELVIVIAVIAILASVLIPTFAGILERAKESARIQAVTSARDEFYSSNENFASPADINGYVFIIDEKAYKIEDGEVEYDKDFDISNYQSVVTNNYISNSEIEVYMPVGNGNNQNENNNQNEPNNHDLYHLVMYIYNGYYGENITYIELNNVTLMSYTVTDDHVNLSIDNNTYTLYSTYPYFTINANIANADTWERVWYYDEFSVYFDEIDGIGEGNSLWVEFNFENASSSVIVTCFDGTQGEEGSLSQNLYYESTLGSSDYYLTVNSIDEYDRITSLTIDFAGHSQTINNILITDITLWGMSIKGDMLTAYNNNEEYSYTGSSYAGNNVNIVIATCNIKVNISGGTNYINYNTRYFSGTNFYYSDDINLYLDNVNIVTDSPASAYWNTVVYLNGEVLSSEPINLSATTMNTILVDFGCYSPHQDVYVVNDGNTENPLIYMYREDWNDLTLTVTVEDEKITSVYLYMAEWNNYTYNSTVSRYVDIVDVKINGGSIMGELDVNGVYEIPFEPCDCVISLIPAPFLASVVVANGTKTETQFTLTDCEISYTESNGVLTFNDGEVVVSPNNDMDMGEGFNYKVIIIDDFSNYPYSQEHWDGTATTVSKNVIVYIIYTASNYPSNDYNNYCVNVDGGNTVDVQQWGSQTMKIVVEFNENYATNHQLDSVKVYVDDVVFVSYTSTSYDIKRGGQSILVDNQTEYIVQFIDYSTTSFSIRTTMD